MAVYLKTLQGRIFFITSFTIFLLVGLSLLYQHNNYKKSLYQRLVIHMKENSFSIRARIESANNPFQIQKIIEEFRHRQDEHEHGTESSARDPFEIPPHEIHVVDGAGVITASTDPELKGIPLEKAMHHGEAGLHDVLKGTAQYAVENMEHSGVRVIDISVPIRKNGRVVGALHYVEPYLKLDRLIRDSLLQHSLFALVLITSLSLSINYQLKKMVMKPLRDMSNEMKRIRLEGHGKDVAMSSNDEIGLLVQSFNEMAYTLREREEEVNKYTAKLEELVNVRKKKLEESHAQLLHSQKLASLGIIASGVAHEINNPLGGMFNCVEMLEQKWEDEEFRKRYIELLKDGLNRIEGTVGKLLWMSRKRERTPQLVEIKRSLKYAYSFFEYMMGKKGIVYKENVEDGMSVVMDPQDLQQVLINLIVNAIQSMKEGDTLSVDAYRDNSNVILEVSDTGEGIEKENLDKIFNPFYTTKQPGEGTGLGLWLTHEIVENYNYEISVKSKRTEGSKFSIVFNNE